MIKPTPANLVCADGKARLRRGVALPATYQPLELQGEQGAKEKHDPDERADDEAEPEDASLRLRGSDLMRRHLGREEVAVFKMREGGRRGVRGPLGFLSAALGHPLVWRTRSSG